MTPLHNMFLCAGMTDDFILLKKDRCSYFLYTHAKFLRLVEVFDCLEVLQYSLGIAFFAKYLNGYSLEIALTGAYLNAWHPLQVVHLSILCSYMDSDCCFMKHVHIMKQK